METVQPSERSLYRPERRALRLRLRVQGARGLWPPSGLEARHSRGQRQGRNGDRLHPGFVPNAGAGVNQRRRGRGGGFVRCDIRSRSRSKGSEKIRQEVAMRAFPHKRRQLGFAEDTREGAALCRWVVDQEFANVSKTAC